MKKLSALFLGLILFFIACDKDKEGDIAPSTTNTTKTLPASVAGKVILFEYSFDAGLGAPYTLNQEVQFTFSSSGMLFIDTDPGANNGDEISINSFTEFSGEYVWDDATGGYAYNLSFLTDGSINEFNLFGLSNGSFYGQFTPKEDEGGNGGSEGTITVSGDFNKVGGASFTPTNNIKCSSCSIDTYTFTQGRDPEPDKVLQVKGDNASMTIEFSSESAFIAVGSGADLGVTIDENAKTITFNNTAIKEKFSQPGNISLVGTLTYN